MLIETTAGDLRQALMKLKPVISKRNTIPILTSVLLEGGAVQGTNLDMEMRVTFAAGRFVGAAAVPFRKLLHIVGALPADEDIRLTRPDSESGTVFLTFKGGRYSLPSFGEADFPRLPQPEGETVMRKPDGLLAALEACEPFIYTEETRYYLNGVCFGIGQNGMGALIATDGHRLIEHPFDHDARGQIILPCRALPALRQLPEPAKVLVCRTHMTFNYAPGCWFRTKLIDGTYPDWRRWVPDPVAAAAGGHPRLTFCPVEMMTVLNRLTLGKTRRANARSVTIASSGSGLVVVTCTHEDDERGAERLVSADATYWQEMSEGIWSVNAAYLKDICQVFRQCDRIIMTAAGNEDPAILMGKNSAVLTVLMPMRGGSETAAKAALHALTPTQIGTGVPAGAAEAAA